MPKDKNFFTDIIRNPACYIMVLPAFFYTMIYGYLSYPYLIIAFKKFSYSLSPFDMILKAEWIGLKNFEFFFKSTLAYTVTRNTIVLNVLFIVLTTVFSVILALLLNEIKSKGFVKITQSTYIFPRFVSWVVVYYIVYSFCSTESGILNKAIESLGGQKVRWYQRPEFWPWILAVIRVWKEGGIQSVIMLAAISGIDTSIYESADIDGATRFQKIWNITLPLIMPTVCILTLLAMGRIMFGDFGMIYAIIRDNGSLYETADVIDTYVFRALRKLGDPSQAMAISLYQSFIGFLMVFGSNRLVKKIFPEGTLF